MKCLGCLPFSNFVLTYFRPMFPIYTSKNYHKTSAILMCPDGIEMEDWPGMGY